MPGMATASLRLGMESSASTCIHWGRLLVSIAALLRGLINCMFRILYSKGAQKVTTTESVGRAFTFMEFRVWGCLGLRTLWPCGCGGPLRLSGVSAFVCYGASIVSGWFSKLGSLFGEPNIAPRREDPKRDPNLEVYPSLVCCRSLTWIRELVDRSQPKGPMHLLSASQRS